MTATAGPVATLLRVYFPMADVGSDYRPHITGERSRDPQKTSDTRSFDPIRPVTSVNTDVVRVQMHGAMHFVCKRLEADLRQDYSEDFGRKVEDVEWAHGQKCVSNVDGSVQLTLRR